MIRKVYKKTFKILLATLMCGNIISDTYSNAFTTAIANPNNTNVTALEAVINTLTGGTKAFDDAVISQYFANTNDLQSLFDATTNSADGTKARTFINNAIKWIFSSISPITLTQLGAAPTQPDVSYTSFTAASAATIDGWYSASIPSAFANAVRAQHFINPSDLQSLIQTLTDDDLLGGNQLANEGQIILDITDAINDGLDTGTYVPGTVLPPPPPPAPVFFTGDSLNDFGADIVNNFFSPTGTVPTDFNTFVLNKYNKDADGKSDIQDLFDMMGLSKFTYGTAARNAINAALSPLSLSPSLSLADFKPDASNSVNSKKLASFFEEGSRVPASFDEFVLEKFNSQGGLIDLREIVRELMKLHGFSNTRITGARLAAESIIKIVNINLSQELSIQAFLGLENKDIEELRNRTAQVLADKTAIAALGDSLSKHADLIKIFSENLDLKKNGDKFTSAVDKMDDIAWDRIEEVSKHTIALSSIPILRIYFYLYGALLDLPAFDIAKRTGGFEDFYSNQSPVFTAQFNMAKAKAPEINSNSKTQTDKAELDRDIDIRNKIATDEIEALVKKTNDYIANKDNAIHPQSLRAYIADEERQKLLNDFYKQLYNIMILDIQKEQPAGHMKQIIENYLLNQYSQLKDLKADKAKDSFEKAWSNAQVSKLFDLLKLDTELLKKVSSSRLPTRFNASITNDIPTSSAPLLSSISSQPIISAL